MTAGPAAWWCFMGYQTEPLRARGITRTLTALFAVWETNVTSIRRALARRQRRWECVGVLYTCCVTLEQRLASHYLQLAFVPLKHFFLLVHLIITSPVLCFFFFFSIIRHPVSNNVDVAADGRRRKHSQGFMKHSCWGGGNVTTWCMFSVHKTPWQDFVAESEAFCWNGSLSVGAHDGSTDLGASCFHFNKE